MLTYADVCGRKRLSVVLVHACKYTPVRLYAEDLPACCGIRTRLELYACMPVCRGLASLCGIGTRLELHA
jgi:hypothetical protein